MPNETVNASQTYALPVTQVFAKGWNLTGTVSGSAGNYTINWSNGTVWNEAAANVPSLAGAWNINGLPTQVQQNGPTLTFTNEFGQTSVGYFLSSTQVFASGWNLVANVVSI